MISLKEEKKRRFLVNFAVAVAVAALAWVCLKYLIGWLMPFILGYLAAALVQPVVYLLHKKLHFRRKFAAVFCVLLLILLVVGLLSFGISRIVVELSSVIGMIPGLLREFAEALGSLQTRLSGIAHTLPGGLDVQATAWIDNFSSELTKFSTSMTSSATTTALHAALKVPSFLLGLIVTIMSACFISCDYPHIRGFFMRQLPDKYQGVAKDLKNFFFVTVARLIRAYLLLMSITFLQLAVWITLMRVPHSLMIALLISIVDLLPILGTGTVVIPWAVIELAVGDATRGVLLLVMYVIIAIVRNILEPHIVGHHIGLYPLVTLLAMYLGLQIFGAAGLVVFPIFTIVLKHLHDEGKVRLWND